MRLKYMVLFCFALIFFCSSSSHAKRFYFTRDGLTVPADDSVTPPKDGAISKHLTFKEKMARDASKAASEGYTVGQTVKEENGIVYELAKDSKTGAYTFKLYRKGEKKKTGVTTSKKPRVSREDMDRMARIEREKREKLRALALKKEEEERRLKEKQIKEKKWKDKKKQVRKRKDTERRARARKERERKKRIEAEDRIIREAVAEADRREEERRKLEAQRQKNDANDRRLKRGEWAAGLEHRYLKWKTVLKKRVVTTETGSRDETSGIGDKDVFYTKAHGDMLRVRFMATRRLELFLEAGMVYDSLSEILDMDPSYGFGFRYIVKEAEFLNHAGYYLDFSARYMVGTVTESYTDTGGNDFSRSSDFNEIEAGLEAGLRLYKLTLYGGLTYGLFSEDTKREQSLDDPAMLILNDELEEQDNLGLMLGLNYRITPAWTVYAQWHDRFKEGAAAGFQYRF